MLRMQTTTATTIFVSVNTLSILPANQIGKRRKSTGLIGKKCMPCRKEQQKQKNSIKMSEEKDWGERGLSWKKTTKIKTRTLQNRHQKLLQKKRQTQSSKRKERREIKGEETGHIWILECRRGGMVLLKVSTWESCCWRNIIQGRYSHLSEEPGDRDKSSQHLTSAGETGLKWCLFFLSLSLSLWNFNVNKLNASWRWQGS